MSYHLLSNTIEHINRLMILNVIVINVHRLA
jgi:hypothetical protein